MVCDKLLPVYRKSIVQDVTSAISLTLSFYPGSRANIMKFLGINRCHLQSGLGCYFSRAHSGLPPSPLLSALSPISIIASSSEDASLVIVSTLNFFFRLLHRPHPSHSQSSPPPHLTSTEQIKGELHSFILSVRQ